MLKLKLKMGTIISILAAILGDLIALLGWSTIEDGRLCKFSERYFDVHDYHVSKGGDGIPSHFHTYRCSKCKKDFII